MRVSPEAQKMLHDTCEWLVQGYGMERGAKDTWQSAVATWNGISVPLFPLLGSSAAEPSSKAEGSSCYRLEIHWFGDPRTLDS